MILLSLVLIVASAVTLGWGIATTSQELIWTSLLTGLAAVALVVASVLRRRKLAVDQADGTPTPAESASAPAGPTAQDHWPWSGTPTGPSGAPSGAPGVPRSGWTGAVDPGVPTAAAPLAADDLTVGSRSGAVEPSADRETEFTTAADRPLGEPFPPSEVAPGAAAPAPVASAAVEDGEPPVEDVPVRDALRVAQLDDAVVVDDGHPRYHLAECPTLAGAAPVPMAVSAARRGGFTPCGVCGPDRTLLARSAARRAGPALSGT